MPRRTLIVCGLILLVFAAISYSAVLTKNATIDEPTHAMSGWMVIRHGDYRVETVNPPLWKCWAAMGNLFSNPPLFHKSVIWNDLTWDTKAEVLWSGQTLYQSPGFDGAAFINRARGMMLIVALALGIAIAIWSYQLAGSAAAIAATTLFCLDPTVIAHAPLVKSDVAFALVLLLLARAVWRLGQRATLSRIFSTGLLCGIAINVKFSGVLVGPVLALLLLLRAMLPDTWTFAGHELRSHASRLIGGVIVGIFAMFCCFAVTWACYGFHYRPAPSPSVSMDMPAIYARAQLVEATVKLGHIPTAAESADVPPGLFYQVIHWANDRHLLPQAMLAGFLYQHTCVQLWPAFLNGELYGNGRWNYFPLALLYKTPVAELLAWLIAGCVLVVMVCNIAISSQRIWIAASLGIPFTVFAAAAVTTHLNIGLRNVLPFYPLLEISTGCAAAYAWKHRPRLTRTVSIVLCIALVYETLSAWPDFIAFFNFPSGGSAGGIAHLSDSNLDWGQDLKTLAAWRRQHPQLPLYAKLFDSVDPAFYGLNYHEISIAQTGASMGKPVTDIPMTPGWIAVSATHLQGLYIRPYEKWFYQRLAANKPVTIIGGTIYVYEFRP